MDIFVIFHRLTLLFIWLILRWYKITVYWLQEKYGGDLRNAYMKGSDLANIIYDVSNRDSFLNVQQWLSEITRYSPENVTKILIGNKCDLSERKVT